MKRLSILAVLLAAVAFTTPRAEAQVSFIPYIGYDFDAGIDSGALLVGVGTEVGFLPGVFPVALSLRPSAEYYFLDDVAGLDEQLFKINADAIARLGEGIGPLGLYAGGGLALMFRSIDVEGTPDRTSSTDLGFNILGGAEFGTAFTRPFVQGRLTLGDGTSLALLGGVRLAL